MQGVNEMRHIALDQHRLRVSHMSQAAEFKEGNYVSNSLDQGSVSNSSARLTSLSRIYSGGKIRPARGLHAAAWGRKIDV